MFLLNVYLMYKLLMMFIKILIIYYLCEMNIYNRIEMVVNL